MTNLEERLSPFVPRELAPQDYINMCEIAIDVASTQPYSRRIHGLGIDQDLASNVGWQRGVRHNRLLVINDGANFLLNSIVVEGERRVIRSVDQYLIGLNHTFVGGMMRTMHDLSGKERTTEEYVREANRQGIVGKNEPRNIGHQQKIAELRGFRKAFFSILDRVDGR